MSVFYTWFHFISFQWFHRSNLTLFWYSFQWTNLYIGSQKFLWDHHIEFLSRNWVIGWYWFHIIWRKNIKFHLEFRIIQSTYFAVYFVPYYSMAFALEFICIRFYCIDSSTIWNYVRFKHTEHVSTVIIISESCAINVNILKHLLAIKFDIVACNQVQ